MPPDSSNALTLGEGVYISPDARIHPSTRGTRIIIGAHTQIYDFVCIRAVGGTGDLVMGEHCYINPHCVMFTGNGITLGNYVLLAPGVMLMPANHAFDRRDIPVRHQGFLESKGGISIEDDVWIGANSVILDGTHIGKGAVIAAGSVVRGQVPPYEIWGGTPAMKIKNRPA
ncbi:MAG TPA: acyltransferase [Prosthecobacter sp.]|jgi:virginiamycin A acetyltransferase|nr:acyltransferase [Prosthecobacter sp.]